MLCKYLVPDFCRRQVTPFPKGPGTQTGCKFGSNGFLQRDLGPKWMGSCTLRTLPSGACGEPAGLIENMCKTKTPNHKTLNPRPTRLSSENTRKADTDYVAEVALLRAEDHLNQTAEKDDQWYLLGGPPTQ